MDNVAIVEALARVYRKCSTRWYGQESDRVNADALDAILDDARKWREHLASCTVGMRLPMVIEDDALPTAAQSITEPRQPYAKCVTCGSELTPAQCAAMCAQPIAGPARAQELETLLREAQPWMPGGYATDLSARITTALAGPDANERPSDA